MNSNESGNGPTAAETLRGAGEVRVKNSQGNVEHVLIRQLPLREMEALLAAQGDEVRLALLYTGRDQGWFDGLDPASQEAIVEEGDRINSDFFGRWFRRRIERQEKLMPGSRAKLFGLLDGTPLVTEPAADGRLQSLPPVRLVPAG